MINRKIILISAITALFAYTVTASAVVLCPASFTTGAESTKFSFWNGQNQPYKNSELWAVGGGSFVPQERYTFVSAEWLGVTQTNCHYQLVDGQKTATVISMPVAHLVPTRVPGSKWNGNNCDAQNVALCPLRRANGK